MYIWECPLNCAGQRDGGGKVSGWRHGGTILFYGGPGALEYLLQILVLWKRPAPMKLFPFRWPAPLLPMPLPLPPVFPLPSASAFFLPLDRQRDGSHPPTRKPTGQPPD